MGQALKHDTKNIMYAYLTLGLLEENRVKNNNADYLSQESIKKKIDKTEIGDRISIGRFLEDIRDWLEFTGFTEDQTKELIETKPRIGNKLNSTIHKNAYRDYIAILLFLTLIEDGRHKEHLGNLVEKEGDPPLSLITNLIIAKRKNLELILKLSKEDIGKKIKPKYFSLSDKIWKVCCEINSEEINLELSKIYSVNFKKGQEF